MIPTIAPVENVRCLGAFEGFPPLAAPSVSAVVFGLPPLFPLTLSVVYVEPEEVGVRSPLAAVEPEKPKIVGGITRELSETTWVLK